jgi:hypothetical protein
MPGAILPRDVTAWLADALADADRRGLPELKPLLENLAQATAALRAADWNENADDSPRGPDT